MMIMRPFLISMFLISAKNVCMAENDPSSRSEREAKAKGVLSDMVQQLGSVFIKEAVEEVGETIQEVMEGKLGNSDKDKDKNSSGRVVWVSKDVHVMLNVDQANAFDNALHRNSSVCAQILQDAVVADPAPFGYSGSNQADYDKFMSKVVSNHRFGK